jgi:hypothetical protein
MIVKFRASREIVCGLPHEIPEMKEEEAPQ